ncbi:MAG: hypothetical protein ABI120_08665, partial [Gemmatimonadaceae bacterium]
VVLFSVASSSSAQTPTVVREVAAPSATSTHPFQFIFTVRETSGGRVLVNDPYRHQLILLDANLSNASVAIDSSNPGGQSYGDFPSPNIKWLGDSSLHMDAPSRSLLVLDGSGKVIRTMAPPKQSDFGRLFSDQSGLDASGNILYRGFAPVVTTDTFTTADRATVRKSHPPDSVGLVRGNFQSRSVDTIAKLKQDGSAKAVQTTKFDGKKLLYITLNPLVSVDEWAVLSDGTLAIVRGYDYHVDFTLRDGTKQSSGKLPFDWKRLTDEDKQHLIDSSRAIIEKIRADADATGGNTAGNDAVIAYLRNSTTPNPRGTPSTVTANLPPRQIEATTTYDYAPLSEMADYYPPIRVGATKTDEDGNLWMLPTTSAQSKRGELVYDVVNPRNDAFYRVRLPVGRSIAGFGKNGVVYLMSRDGDQWKLERTRVIGTAVSARD